MSLLRLTTLLLLAIGLLAACGRSGPSTPTDAVAGPSPTPLPPATTPSQAAQQFLDLWQGKRYSEMYDLLSAAAQQGIGREEFAGRYQAIADEATITGIDFLLDPAAQPLPGQTAADSAFKIVIHTAFFGDVSQDNVAHLVEEDTGWKVNWTPSLILRQLAGNTLVHFFLDVPKRGTIYDRHGNPLALDAEVATIGIVPDLTGDIKATIAALATRLKMPAEDIAGQLKPEQPSHYFYPIKRLPYDTPQSVVDEFYTIRGVLVRRERLRVYPQGPLAAHVLGYMGEVSPQDLETLTAKGFRPGDFIGRAGLEVSFQEELAGERGGRLAVITPGGEVVAVIAGKPSRPGVDVYLSLDLAVQQTAEAALGERTGSIVVMDPTNNSVLAMASYPDFDPNQFFTGFTADEWRQLSSDTRLPLLNRAAQATYPPGSTFKVVTAAAGLEKGGYSAYSTIGCTPLWSGLGRDFVKANWQTFDRGPLTLAEGLMASCNTVFYEVALTLDHKDPEVLPSFATAFGLGRPTGIAGIEEAGGVVPTPDWKKQTFGEPWYSGDSVNMGIGQGFMLVTPLQVANMYSAIASGGPLRSPLLVRKTVGADGSEQLFTAQEKGPLPASQGALNVIRQGLGLVVSSPGGTAYQVFAGSPVPFAGKSGTAEDLAVGQDHVWFVAYAPRGNPRAVAVVTLDEGKSGSFEAGPIVRQVIEAYLAQGG